MTYSGGDKQHKFTDEEKRRLLQNGSSTISKAFLKSLNEKKETSSIAPVKKETASPASSVPQEVLPHNSNNVPSIKVISAAPLSNSTHVPPKVTIPILTRDESNPLSLKEVSSASEDKISTEAEVSISDEVVTEFYERSKKDIDSTAHFKSNGWVALLFGIVGSVFLVTAVLISIFTKTGVEITTNVRLEGDIKERFIERLLNPEIFELVREYVMRPQEKGLKKEVLTNAFLKDFRTFVDVQEVSDGRKFFLSVRYPDAESAKMITRGLYRAILVNYVTLPRQEYWEGELKIVEQALKENEKRVSQLTHDLDETEHFDAWFNLPESFQRQVQPMIALIYRAVQTKADDADTQLARAKEKIMTGAPSDFLQFFLGSDFDQQSPLQTHKQKLINIFIEQELLSFCGVQAQDYLRRSFEQLKLLERETQRIIAMTYQRGFSLTERRQLVQAGDFVVDDARHAALRILENTLSKKRLPQQSAAAIEGALRNLGIEIDKLLALRKEIIAKLSQPMPELANLIVNIKRSRDQALLYTVILASCSLASFGFAIRYLKRP